jgi:RNA polymerase primary sigma factor
VLEALDALSIHPNQLRALDEALAVEPKRNAAFRRQAGALHSAHRRFEESKASMLKAHLHLVPRMARRYVGRGIDFTDLWQEGAVGLMRAVERFDYRRGLRFQTYARWWIRQAFTRALADQSRTIRLPVNVNERLTRMQQVSSELAQKLHREPTVEETAEASGLSTAKATQLLESHRATRSLDEPVSDDGETSLIELVADSGTEEPAEPVARAELEHALAGALAELKPNEQKVLKRRFGLGGVDEATLEEIGGSLGVSRERVRQIESKALKALRRKTQGLQLDAYL